MKPLIIIYLEQFKNSKVSSEDLIKELFNKNLPYRLMLFSVFYISMDKFIQEWEKKLNLENYLDTLERSAIKEFQDFDFAPYYQFD